MPRSHRIDAQNDDGDTRLILAVKKNRADRVQALLAKGADPDIQNEDGETALHRAASCAHDATLAQCLIDSGANLNIKDNEGDTPLICAVIASRNDETDVVTDLDVVRALLAKGADPDIQNEDGETALHLAASCAHDAKLAQFLIDFGADPNIKNDDGDTPLICAVIASRNDETDVMTDLDVVRDLLDKGADPNIQNKDGDTALHLAVSYVHDATLAQSLTDSGADPNIPNQDGETALRLAVNQDDTEIEEKILLSQGIDRVPVNGPTLVDAFMYALQINKFDHVECLLRFVSKMDISPELKQNLTTRLSKAVEDEDQDRGAFETRQKIVQALLAAGADPMDYDLKTVTPLYASECKEIMSPLLDAIPLYSSRPENALAMLTLLLNASEPSPVRSKLISSALIKAVMADNLGCVRFLLDHGADANVRETVDSEMSRWALTDDPKKKGRLVLFWALRQVFLQNRVEIVKALLEHGANPNAVDKSGKTALYWAAELGDKEIVTALLEKKGVDPNQCHHESKESLLLRAVYFNRKEIVQALIEGGADLNIESVSGASKDTKKHVLEVAVNSNHVEIVKILFAAQKPIKLEKKRKAALLETAVTRNDTEMVLVLIEQKAISWTDENQQVSLLRTAISKGNVTCVKALLEEGVNPNVQRDGDYTSVLRDAVNTGNLELVNLLLSKDTNPNQSDQCWHKDKKSILMEAVQKAGKRGGDWVEIVRALLSNNADCHVFNDQGQSVLECAVNAGNSDLMHDLLAAGADCHVSNGQGQSVLECAVNAKNLHVVQILLSADKSDYKHHCLELNAALVAVGVDRIHDKEQDEVTQAVKALLQKGADPNIKDMRRGDDTHWGQPSVLSMAVRFKQEGVVHALLEHGADPNVTDQHGETPLSIAAKQDDSNMLEILLGDSETLCDQDNLNAALITAVRTTKEDNVQCLLDAKANPNTLETPFQETVLTRAVRARNPSMLNLLIRSDKCDEDNLNRALTVAIREGYVDGVELLLQHGANPNVANQFFNPLRKQFYDSDSVLKIAVDLYHQSMGLTLYDRSDTTTQDQYREIVQNLLKQSAHTQFQDRWGDTINIINDVVKMAIEGEDLRILNIFLQEGAFTPKDFTDSLMLAANKGHVGCVQALLGAGAHLQSIDENGNTALMLAANKGHVDCVRSLVGTPLDQKNNEGDTALMLAANKGHVDCVQALLDAGANSDYCKEETVELTFGGSYQELKSPLLAAIEIDRSSTSGAALEILELLLKKDVLGAKPFDIEHLKAAWVKAIEVGDSACVKALLTARNDSQTDYEDDDAPLQTAAKQDNPDILKMLLSNYLRDPVCNQHNLCAALIEAVDAQQEKNVKILLEAGALLAVQGEDDTPFKIAARKDNPDILKMLLEHPSQAGCYQDNLNATLIEAVYNEQVENVKLLIELGADPSDQDHHLRCTALEVAAKDKDSEILRLLLQSDRCQPALTAALIEAVKGDYHSCVQLLLEHGADPTDTRSSESALTVAVEKYEDEDEDEGEVKDKVDLVKMLLESSKMKFDEQNLVDALILAIQYDINHIKPLLQVVLSKHTNPSKALNTVLVNAVLEGNLEWVQVLLKAGADPDYFEEETVEHTFGGSYPELNGSYLELKSPLLDAVKADDLDCVRILLKKGANPNRLDHKGRPVLVGTIIQGQTEIFQALLNASADPNCQYQDSIWGSRDPLVEAVEKKCQDYVKALLKKGANPNCRYQKKGLYASEQQTALQMAVKHDDSGIFEMLLSHGDPSIDQDNLNATLIEAVAANRQDYVKALLKKGAHPNCRHQEKGLYASEEQTALQMAVKHDDSGIFEMLLSHYKTPIDQDNLNATLIEALYEKKMQKIKILFKKAPFSIGSFTDAESKSLAYSLKTINLAELISAGVPLEMLLAVEAFTADEITTALLKPNHTCSEANLTFIFQHAGDALPEYNRLAASEINPRYFEEWIKIAFKNSANHGNLCSIMINKGFPKDLLIKAKPKKDALQTALSRISQEICSDRMGHAAALKKVEQLHTQGFTFDELKAAGFTAAVLSTSYHEELLACKDTDYVASATLSKSACVPVDQSQLAVFSPAQQQRNAEKASRGSASCP